MSGVLSKILPARAQATPVKVIADLDMLVPQPMGFRLGGKVYQIRIGTIRQLAGLQDRLNDILALLNEMSRGSVVKDEDLHKAYHRYLSVLCPEMTLQVVQSMLPRQLRRLLKDVHTYAMGQNMGYGGDAESDQKKKQTPTSLT